VNVLVVGYGSIGRRHLANLSASDRVHNIFVCTKRALDGDAGQRGKIRQTAETLPDFFPHGVNSHAIDFAVIANETHKHVEAALYLARRGVHLFIEKPISHNRNGLDELRNTSIAKGIKLSIGYNLRFLDAMAFIKKELGKGVLGKLYFARIEVGQYLPQWRPQRDYRDIYSASRDKGGGVGLDLSHEIDYMRYVFGDPAAWKVMKTKAGDLDIDVEDVFEGVYLYGNGFVCTVHLDYLQMKKERKLTVKGEKGTLTCDFAMQRIDVAVQTPGETTTSCRNETLFDVTRTYVDEMDRFIDALYHDTRPSVTIDDGIRVLELLEDSHV
jgi:predicted dehydrogenase